ncbi:uncharacterized protein MONBRDRAFT_30491 [Monosiga brevicollis MX1]|uniref:SCA7 domain-containing protein n=1 Tax=Monosiga brevicollis TaxID=81824 RepID=A9VE29_MONBE|nr:uncharacterized protein MONBRDRAFT_30491 [Monosiga brevicollis MX1]EDQ84205.1 predicted protein [Monosiga brevicollis MX1]|eukprot:XP_001750993.1 hypothetical protein [Monosiga brevicollis MX1]
MADPLDMSLLDTDALDDPGGLLGDDDINSLLPELASVMGHDDDVNLDFKPDPIETPPLLPTAKQSKGRGNGRRLGRRKQSPPPTFAQNSQAIADLQTRKEALMQQLPPHLRDTITADGAKLGLDSALSHGTTNFAVGAPDLNNGSGHQNGSAARSGAIHGTSLFNPEDRNLFGQYPLKEEARFVTCPKCDRRLLERAFAAHQALGDCRQDLPAENPTSDPLGTENSAAAAITDAELDQLLDLGGFNDFDSVFVDTSDKPAKTTKAKGQRSGTPKTEKSKNTRETKLDPNRHCYVLDPKTGKHCHRALTCKEKAARDAPTKFESFPAFDPYLDEKAHPMAFLLPNQPTPPPSTNAATPKTPMTPGSPAPAQPLSANGSKTGSITAPRSATAESPGAKGKGSSSKLPPTKTSSSKARGPGASTSTGATISKATDNLSATGSAGVKAKKNKGKTTTQPSNLEVGAIKGHTASPAASSTTHKAGRRADAHPRVPMTYQERLHAPLPLARPTYGLSRSLTYPSILMQFFHPSSLAQAHSLLREMNVQRWNQRHANSKWPLPSNTQQQHPKVPLASKLQVFASGDELDRELRAVHTLLATDPSTKRRLHALPKGLNRALTGLPAPFGPHRRRSPAMQAIRAAMAARLANVEVLGKPFDDAPRAKRAHDRERLRHSLEQFERDTATVEQNDETTGSTTSASMPALIATDSATASSSPADNQTTPVNQGLDAVSGGAVASSPVKTEASAPAETTPVTAAASQPHSPEHLEHSSSLSQDLDAVAASSTGAPLATDSLLAREYARACKYARAQILAQQRQNGASVRDLQNVDKPAATMAMRALIQHTLSMANVPVEAALLRHSDGRLDSLEDHLKAVRAPGRGLPAAHGTKKMTARRVLTSAASWMPSRFRSRAWIVDTPSTLPANLLQRKTAEATGGPAKPAQLSGSAQPLLPPSSSSTKTPLGGSMTGSTKLPASSSVSHGSTSAIKRGGANVKRAGSRRASTDSPTSKGTGPTSGGLKRGSAAPDAAARKAAVSTNKRAASASVTPAPSSSGNKRGGTGGGGAQAKRPHIDPTAVYSGSDIAPTGPVPAGSGTTKRGGAQPGANRRGSTTANKRTSTAPVELSVVAPPTKAGRARKKSKAQTPPVPAPTTASVSSTTARKRPSKAQTKSSGASAAALAPTDPSPSVSFDDLDVAKLKALEHELMQTALDFELPSTTGGAMDAPIGSSAAGSSAAAAGGEGDMDVMDLANIFGDLPDLSPEDLAMFE